MIIEDATTEQPTNKNENNIDLIPGDAFEIIDRIYDEISQEKDDIIINQDGLQEIYVFVHKQEATPVDNIEKLYNSMPVKW